MRLPRAWPAALAVLGGLTQIAYPLVHGSVRSDAAVAIVALFAAAALGHAARCRALVALVGCGLIGYAVELIAVHTGVPFGRYHYLGGLGPAVGGVPLLIAAAWTMLTWPAALAARRLTRRLPGRIVIGAWALASWDLFLDPQMVAAGHWRWRHSSPHLPGVAHVPLSNYAGWLLVSLVLSAVLQYRMRGEAVHRDRMPVLVYVWTWAASTLGLAAFLHLGAAAAWGGVLMGTVAVPVMWLSRRRIAR